MNRGVTGKRFTGFLKEIDMRKYTFHLLGLAHLPTSRHYSSCAFTQKNIKLAKMLCDVGHKVYLYGARGTEGDYRIEDYIKSKNFYFIETHTIEDIAKDYGEGDNRFEIGYNWTRQDFKHDLNSERKSSTLKFYTNSISKINDIKKNDDFLLLTQGHYHKPIADNVKLYLSLESGIGYRGSISGYFRAFESPYIQNFTYGSENPHQSLNGSYYDRVIPNYFDGNDFKFNEQKGDFLLFIGRLIKRKGIITAYLSAKHLGKKLIIAGQGGHINSRGHLVDESPQEFDIPNDSDWEYVGYADVETRKQLMSEAYAIYTPTEYLECFAGTHVEGMLSGTPPITTDFGVFPYTIPDYLNGKVGFRCNTLQDFVNAGKKAKTVDHKFVRKYAERFLMENVVKDYQKWFDDLYRVYLSTDGKKRGWHHVS